MSIRREKSCWFPVFMAILVLINGMSIYAGLQKLEAFLVEYEAGTPAAAIEEFLSMANGGEYGAILDETGFEESRFVRSEHGEEYLKGLFGAAAGRLEAVTDPAGGGCYIYDSGSGTKLAGLTAERTDSGWKLSLSYPVPDGSTVISAPEGVRVRVNGAELDSGDIQGGPETVAGFSGAGEDLQLPAAVRYRVTGFFGEPEVTACMPSGESLEVVSGGDGFTVLPPEAAGQELERAAALMEPAAKAYARFITGDAGFDELGALLRPDTEFYSAVRGFYNGWYIDHESYGFRDMETENVSLYGENAFAGDISFSYVIKKGAKEFDYPSAYRMYFLMTDSGWKCVNIGTR